MSLVDWNKNIVILKNIIDEYIQEERLIREKPYIIEQVNNIINRYYDIRFDYRSAIELNKDILKDVIYIIGQYKVKKIKQRPKIEEVYSRDDILRQRNNDFEQTFAMKKKEFESFNRKKVQDIDFRDKNQQPEQNIDELMEKITKERENDLEATKKLNVDEKAVKEWISKGGNIDMETELHIDNGENETNIGYKNTNDITQPLQKKVKSNIIDKLTEELIQERKYETYKAGDSILKNTSNKVVNEREPVEKSVSFTDEQDISPSLDMFKNRIKPVSQINNDNELEKIFSYLKKIDDKIDRQFQEINLRLTKIEGSKDI